MGGDTAAVQRAKMHLIPKYGYLNAYFKRKSILKSFKISKSETMNLEVDFPLTLISVSQRGEGASWVRLEL